MFFNNEPDQVLSIPIDSEIIPSKGIGPVKLGMNCFYLKDIITENYKGKMKGNGDTTFYHFSYDDKDDEYYSIDNDKKEWNFGIGRPFFNNLYLYYKGFISISINLFTSKVSNITVEKDFKGKLFNQIGIGDTIRQFYEESKSFNCNFCEFIEGHFFFWVEKRWGLGIYVGDADIDCPSDDEFEGLLDMPIYKIEIFDDLQRIPVGEKKYPKKWKK